MKKKFLGRVLTMLLVASMVFTLLPASAVAAGNWWWNADEYTEEAAPTATADNSSFMRIFHLDCGRKYFSVAEIEGIIDQLAANHYTHIELAVGNDGLRFLLDDMALEVNGTTYTTQQVSDAIRAGNKNYHDAGENNELTETQMNGIINYANGKNIKVIPLLNTPGHMDAILSAANTLTGTNCSYNGSARTIDVTNTTAVAFTKALLQKYIDYFANKDCKYFNMGADEYANDLKTGGGFSSLISARKYNYFVDYVNTVAGMIIEKGMTPIAFNDGIYYNSDTNYGTFKTDIVISFWTSGWSGYSPARASFLANKGHKLINTNDAWYYVLGLRSNGYSLSHAQKGVANTSCTTLASNDNLDSIGCMQCLWCDEPSASYSADEVANVYNLITTFSGNNPSMFVAPSQPDTGITITPEGGTTGTTGAPKLDAAQPEQLKLTASEKVLWSWNSEVVNLTSADPAEEISTIDAYTLQELEAKSVFVTPIAAGDPAITVTTLGENSTTKTYPVEVVDSKAPAEGETVNLTIGGTYELELDGNVVDTLNKGDLKESIATVEANSKTVPGKLERQEGEKIGVNLKDNDGPFNGVITDGKGHYMTVSGNTIGNTNKVSEATEFTVTRKKEFNGYRYTISTGTKYLSISSNAVTLSDSSQTLSYNNDRGFYYHYSFLFLSSDYYICYNNGNWTGLEDNGNGFLYSVRDVETAPVDKTTFTFTGVAKGTTYVTIGGTLYTIKVTDKAPAGTLASDTITLEYWITNNKVYEGETTSTNHTKSFTTTTVGAMTEDGISIANAIPEKAYGFFDGTKEVYYWQAVRLDSANKQTGENGVDQTAAGTVLTHIRYHGGAWQYKTLGGDWMYFLSDDQLVAYYLQRTEVTKEVDTYFKDWGFAPGNGSDDHTSDGKVALSVAVVYPDGTLSPSEDKLLDKTVIFNYWTNGTRNIGIVAPRGNDDYEISKITYTHSKSVASTVTSSVWPTSGTIEWKKKQVEGGTAEWYDENVVWDEVTDAGTTPMANGTVKDIKWPGKSTAILVLVYLKPVEKQTNLNLVYHDKTDNQDIKSSQIVMKYTQGSDIPTYFNSLYNGGTVNQSTGAVTGGTLIAKDNKTNWPGKTASETDYLPDAAYVVNSANVAQHFNKEIARIPGVAPKYQSGFYKYDGAEISADGKTLTLRYVIDDTKLENQYVIDFGLPLHIPLSDLVKNAANVDAVYANGTMLSGDTDYIAQHGTLRYDAAAKEIIYKRTATFSDDTISTASFQVRYSGDTALSKTFTIGVLPASNVLYEASFLTQVSKDNGPAWTLTTAATRTQETQKVGDTTTNYAVFGRDTAYNNAYGALGAWTVNGLKFNSRTRALTTSFYGNGFDLIGNCGPRTGRVILFIKNPETGKGKLVDVDTRYGADTFYQVPLAHVMMAEEASYSVTVYAAGLKATNAPPANYSLRGAATYASDYAADSYDAVLNGVLAENGLTMADVEYVKVESAPAAAKTARRATSFYALDTAAETGPVTHEAGDHVEIDGFRVYRSKNNTNYPESEQNVQYLNILDAVSSFTAFVEGSTADSKWKARDQYENAGGPQNEIYLRKTNGENSAIAFKIDPNAIVQISARAVENEKAAKLVVNGTETVIATNTEMYYTFTAGADGIVTIKNEGEGMLALGNLKIKNGTQAVALSEEDYPAAIALLSLNAAPETPDTVFEPTISAKVTTTKFIRSKVVTLTVSASADVAKLTVNGTELRPTNGWLVSMGWSKSYNYILTETAKKSETKTYEIIGYSADGTPSTPTVVKSK